MERFDFREIVEQLPLVVYVDEVDEACTPIYVSPQIERLLGYTREEWLGNADLWRESLHPDDREQILARVEERNRTGNTPGLDEYRLITRDGRTIWVRDDEVIIYDEDGKPVLSHGYMQEATARKQDSMRLELLVGILGLAAEERAPEEIVAEAARLLAATVGDVTVTFVDVEPGPELRTRYSTRSNRPVAATLRIPGYLERLEAGPIVVADVAREAWLADVRVELEQQSVGSAVDIPLRRDGRVVGVLWFNTSGPRAWNAHEVTMLSDVAEQLATVLAGAEAREQRSLAARDLRSRDAILGAVSRAAEHFLKEHDLDNAMADLMRALGEATAASRAYVFENVPGDGPVPWCIRRAVWSSSGEVQIVDHPQLGHIAPAPHFPRWAATLAVGEPFSSHIRDLPPEERGPMELVEMLSVLAVPVFVGGEWWGFIGFEDCERERDWSAAETDALRTAAGLVAAAVTRERVERDLRRRDAILEAVSHAAARLLAEPTWANVADDLLQRLGVAAEASRAYLFECGLRADGKRVASRRFEWVADGVRRGLDDPLMQDMCFEDVGLARLEATGARNELYAGTVRELSAEERAFFEAQEALTVVAVPIFVDGSWWGFIGFDDCRAEREWSPAELDALRTASSLLAAAVRRERSEAILREHEQKLRAVFDTALDAIFITDDERRYVDVNPAACEYFGIARRDLIGRRIDDFVPPHVAATIEEDWRAYIGGEPVRTQWEVQTADGELRLAEASARPNFLPGLHIAFLRDITERKRLEAELVSAQKLESLGRLAGGVAHDFNNLLTGITGYATLLLDRANGDGAFRRDLGEILRAADRAAELTRQLLAFGRRQMMQPSPLDLNTVIAEVGPLLQRLLGEDVALELRPSPELGTVRADAGQIEQVLVNLAVNARDAMPDGGRFTVETRNCGDDRVEVVCTDTGCGIPEETLAQIFEPFFTTREQGVGLGLASVYGVVHQNGGEVSVESTLGAGTTFTITLPRIADEPRPVEAAPQPAARSGSETILLVEDEDVVRDLTQRVLERQGYTVVACPDGPTAIALAEAEQQTIDLLLTDVVMPGMHGYEVAKRVSASRPEIRILFMSGYAEEALVGRPALSDHLLIEKPFAVDVLARRVREALEA